MYYRLVDKENNRYIEYVNNCISLHEVITKFLDISSIPKFKKLKLYEQINYLRSYGYIIEKSDNKFPSAEEINNFISFKQLLERQFGCNIFC